jgi:hypothetical protein
MNESDERGPGSGDISDTSRDHLQAEVPDVSEVPIVDEPIGVPEGAVKSELESVMEETGDGARAVSETRALNPERALGPLQSKIFLGSLEPRFDTNHELHRKIRWVDVEKALRANPEKLWSLRQMEITGGFPDVIGEEKGEFIFGECSSKSPSGRRNIVFDREAQEYARKNHLNIRNIGNAADLAEKYGVELMSEKQYCVLQKKITIDRNTWSWLMTPIEVREAGRANCGLRCSGTVVVNRIKAWTCEDGGGFRAVLRVPRI